MYLILVFGCDKSSTNNYLQILPPKGNYYSTVFCKINDSNWYDCSPNGGIVGWKGSGVNVDYENKITGTPLVMEITNTCNSSISDLYFYLTPFNGIGKYSLTKRNSGSYAGFTANLEGVNIKPFETNFNYFGTVEITDFDYKEKTVTGTFNFDALYADSNQVVKIKDGKFIKVRYN
jgi:hypothetical protein